MLTANTLNQYRSMWILVMYDLPTDTKSQRKRAQKFRKLLLKDGFNMFQFSSYIRFCPSFEATKTHIIRVKSWLPAEGNVGILKITDKQYELMELFYGGKDKEKELAPQQLEMF